MQSPNALPGEGRLEQVVAIAGPLQAGTELRARTVDGIPVVNQYLAHWDVPAQRWEPEPSYLAGDRLVVLAATPGIWGLFALGGAFQLPVEIAGPAPSVTVSGSASATLAMVMASAASGCGTTPLPVWAADYRVTLTRDALISWCLDGIPGDDGSVVFRGTSTRSYAQFVKFNNYFGGIALTRPAGVPQYPSRFASDLTNSTVFGNTNGDGLYVLLPGEPLEIKVDHREVSDLALANSLPSASSEIPTLSTVINAPAVAAGAAWLAAQWLNVGQRAIVVRWVADAVSRCHTDPRARPAVWVAAVESCLEHVGWAVWQPLMAAGVPWWYTGTSYLPGSAPPALDGSRFAAALTVAALQLAADRHLPAVRPIASVVTRPQIRSVATPCTVPGYATVYVHAVISGSSSLTAYNLNNGSDGAALLVLRSGQRVVDCTLMPDSNGQNVYQLVCTAATHPAQCLAGTQTGPHSSLATFIQIIDGVITVFPAPVRGSATVTFSFVDLDRDGDLDIVDQGVIWEPSYAAGRRYWVTARQDPGVVFIQTGCSKEIKFSKSGTTTDLPQPTILLTGSCTVHN